MSKLKSLNLVFENLEVMKFDASEIWVVSIDGLESSILLYPFVDDGYESMECNKLYIELLSEANKEYCPFDIEDFKMNTFERIKSRKDIAAVELKYENSSEDKYIYVKWNEESDVTNKYQKTYTSNKYRLTIEIGEE